MDTKTLLRRLDAFDPELSAYLERSSKRQHDTLSLIPTENAVSPFSAYLKGSLLNNDIIDYHRAGRISHLEDMAAMRAAKLFGAEHAIVRIGSAASAARVVFFALARPGDEILSFNLRKKEYCRGERATYHFTKFGVEADTLEIDYDHVEKIAMEKNPRIIICSPVSLPRNMDYERMAEIAKNVHAMLWCDLGQNAGLVAAGLVPSPVPYADVVTFAPSDALHGPQNGIVLTTDKLAELMDQAVINTGHVSLKKNVLAALAMTFHEACTEEYHDYAEQTIKNAKALEQGLHEAGAHTLAGPTENHLVLARLHESGGGTSARLAEAGLMVKEESFMTAGTLSFPILRLSALDPTTRSLKEKEMQRLGRVLGNFLRSHQTDDDVEKVRDTVDKLVEGRPLFSEEWLPDAEASDNNDGLMQNAMLYWNA